jgi:indole-3-pyruvate monooxygenase
MQAVIIIGAGPAGLAMAGRLSKARVPYTLLEASDQLAHSWVNHYERLHLHTVKEYSTLPYMDFPSDYPRYVPRAKLLEYYQKYADTYNIKPVYNTTIKWVNRKDEVWQIEALQQGITKQYSASKVIIATGFNRKALVPSWQGQASFSGSIIHSRAYRNPSNYKNKHVLVVGMGNTGAEIALDLAEKGVKATISARSPVNIVPRDFLGRSTQKTAMLLRKLPNALGDQIGSVLHKFTIGDLTKYGIRTPKYPPSAQNRKYGKTPVIDLGTLGRIKNGEIKVKTGVSKFEKQTVHFDDGSSGSYDAVILATGYTSAIQDFVENGASYINTHGHPTELYSAQHPGLYFLGFNAYTTGLLWCINEDSERITAHIIKNN